MKIKDQNEILLTPSRMAIVKNVEENIVGKDMEKLWTSYIAGGSGKWCSHCGKQPGGFSKQQTQNQCVCVCFLLSHVWFFATPWTVAHQAPLSMGFFQGRILEQVDISSSRGSSQPRYPTQVRCISCIGRRILYYLSHLGSPLDQYLV